MIDSVTERVLVLLTTSSGLVVNLNIRAVHTLSGTWFMQESFKIVLPLELLALRKRLGLSEACCSPKACIVSISAKRRHWFGRNITL